MFSSLEHFGLSAWRLCCVGVAVASASWFTAAWALGDVLGQSKLGVLLILSGVVFYLVVSIPKRLFERQRMSEAREAVLLSASAKACLNVTGSRPRTLMMIKPRVPTISRASAGAARRVLLGMNVEDALAVSSEGLASYTAAAILRSIATLRPEGFETGDEEQQGLEESNELFRETRLPMIMTVCFFAPIMLLLYAVFARSYGPVSVSELTFLEFVIVDLAFYLSSGDRSRA